MRKDSDSRGRTIVASLLGLIAAAGGVWPAHGYAPAAMHPEAVLKSDRGTVEAGGGIVLRGSQFGASQQYALQLLGALDERDLGEVSSDADGLFNTSVAIPSDVRPGAYQVVAVAPDGDVAARLDVVVTAAGSMSAQDHAAMGEAAMADHDLAARAEEITIQRDRTGIAWAAIGLVIGAAGGLGIGLRRRSA